MVVCIRQSACDVKFKRLNIQFSDRICTDIFILMGNYQLLSLLNLNRLAYFNKLAFRFCAV